MESKWKLPSDKIATMPVEEYKKQDPIILLYKTDVAMKECARDLAAALDLLEEETDSLTKMRDNRCRPQSHMWLRLNSRIDTINSFLKQLKNNI